MPFGDPVSAMSCDGPWVDSRSYSKRFMLELMGLFRSRPCLWRARGEGEPADRADRDDAWQLITEKLREVEPNANRAFAIKKMNSMKSSWRRECKKLKQQRAKGDIRYKPRLWYYDVLSFIDDDSASGGSGSNQTVGVSDGSSQAVGASSPTSDTSLPMDETIYMDEVEFKVNPFLEEETNTSTAQSTSSASGQCQRLDLGEPAGRAISLIRPAEQPYQPEDRPYTQTTRDIITPTGSRRPLISLVKPPSEHPYQAEGETNSQSTMLQSTASTSGQSISLINPPGRAVRLINPPEPPPSRLDMLGRNWAEKLKELPNDQRIFAEKLINDVLFEAELGTLGRHCHIATQANTQG